MTISGMKSAGAFLLTAITTTTAVKEAIDRARSMGLNTVKLGVRASYVNTYRTASTDPIKDGIKYAASLGMKVMILLSINDYPSGGRETFYTSLTRQAEFLVDMKWAIARFNISGFAGIELEEPHRYSTDAATALTARTAMNAFFVKCKALVPAGMNYGFNLASLSKANHLLQGFDVDYINANKLFTFYGPQLAKNTLSAFQSNYNSATSEFPGFETFPAIYITYTSLVKVAPCTTSWAYPECWNQALFDQLKWCKSQSIPFMVFILERTNISKVYWPQDTTPGSTVADKILYILGAYVPPPPPPLTYNIMACASGMGAVMIDNDPTRQSRTCYGIYKNPGEQYTLTAIPDKGYGLKEWADPAGMSYGNSISITGIASSDLKLTAYFEAMDPEPEPEPEPAPDLNTMWLWISLGAGVIAMILNKKR